MTLTLNSAKSALISLLDGCDDELVDVDDIDDDSSSSITRQMSSSLVALDVLVVGGSTGRERKTTKLMMVPEINVNKPKKIGSRRNER